MDKKTNIVRLDFEMQSFVWLLKTRTGNELYIYISVSQSVSFNHLLSKGCRDPNNEARVREYQWLMKHTRAGDKRAHDYCASFKTSYHPSEKHCGFGLKNAPPADQ